VAVYNNANGVAGGSGGGSGGSSAAGGSGTANQGSDGGVAAGGPTGLLVVVVVLRQLAAMLRLLVMLGRVERAYRRQLLGRRSVERAAVAAVFIQLVTVALQPMVGRLVF
jgi:hypothetical protein